MDILTEIIPYLVLLIIFVHLVFRGRYMRPRPKQVFKKDKANTKC